MCHNEQTIMTAENENPVTINSGAGSQLVLSLFPGIDLLGRAFTETGYCVVKGPDKILGEDIRAFTVPGGRFDGVIGGPPCQDFSLLNRNPGQYGDEMLDHFIRVIVEARPDWYLFENVVNAPQFTVPGFDTEQRFVLDLAWFSPFSRRRDFQFGSRSGQQLNPMYGVRGDDLEPCVVGGDDRSYASICEIHGLGEPLDLSFFTLDGKKQAIANSVPLQLGKYVASMIAGRGEAVPEPDMFSDYRRCLCGCGRVVTGRHSYHNAGCRKRAQRQRERGTIN